MRKVFLLFVVAVLVVGPMAMAHAGSGSITCAIEHKLGVENVKDCESQP